MADSPLPDAQSGSQPKPEPFLSTEETKLTDDSSPAQSTKIQGTKTHSTTTGSLLSRGFRSRGWQWLGLGLALPFLTLNGLAAWQARSLTQYRSSVRPSTPILAQKPLQRLGSFVTGIKIPRPENQFSPADIGLSFEVHKIDLGQGEQLEAWHVKAPEPIASPTETAPEPQSTQADEAVDSPISESATTGTSSTETASSDAIGSDATGNSEPATAATIQSLVSQPPATTKKQGLVLLFPTYAASKQSLLQEVKLLASLGYDSFVVDFQGVGGSSGSDTTLGQREAADVAAAVAYVAQTFDNPAIALYGRLMSAGILLRAVTEYNLEPEALLLEDPYASLYGVAETTVQAVGLPRSPTTQMLMLWGSLLQRTDPVALDPITYSTNLSIPTLLLHGSNQVWTTLDDVVALHSQLAGAKEIVSLPSQPLLPLSATASAPWMDQVEAFLDPYLGN